MTTPKRWLVAALALVAVGGRLGAATMTETNAFNDALRDLSLKSFKRAEADFGRFIQTYTNSPLLQTAILCQAEARIMLTNYDGAIALLAAHQAKAGKLADLYLYWQGEAHFKKGDYAATAPDKNGDYAAAADLFSRVAREFPDSERSLEAVVKEATARARLDDWQRVVDLLRETDGVFQKALKEKPGGDWTTAGSLLLAEGLLLEPAADYPGARAALAPLANLSLNPEMEWQRQSLLCRVDVAEGNLADALAGATNLMAVAAKAGQRSLQADSFALEAGLFENLGRADEAIAAYTNNLAEGVPAKLQRQALWHIADLSFKQRRLAEAMQWVQKFVQEQTNAPGLDVALLVLGELHLRQQAEARTGQAATAAAATNGLEQARESLSRLTTNMPQSPLYGKAELDLGWCYWLETNLVEAAVAFSNAITRLPVSADLATAHFKLGDAQFEQKNFTNALTNYEAVIAVEDAASALAPADRDLLETNLLERAYYQAVRAALAANDVGAATAAATNLIGKYPNGFHTGRAVLLAGSEMSGRGDPAGAREMFAALAKQTTNAALVSELELAGARTYEEEDKWNEAIGQYEAWLASHPDHPDRPRAEYFRALAEFYAGRETNALGHFTNLVAQFPTNEFAPRAQLWIGNYYFNAGNPQEAEKNYELLARNTNASPDLACEAQMMAGRAAVAQQHWNDATNYFTRLCGDPNCTNLVLRSEAAYAYADVLMVLDAPATNKLANLKNAILLFSQICESSNRLAGLSYEASNRLVELAALAWGEKALCYLQWTNDAPQYEEAMTAFTNVIAAPRADATARAIARVGMAVVFEKRAEHASAAEQTELLEQAREIYEDVLTEKDLRTGQRPDLRCLFWVEKAGLDAGRVSERLQDWPRAAATYDMLEQVVPELRDVLEEKRVRAKKNADAAVRRD